METFYWMFKNKKLAKQFWIITLLGLLFYTLTPFICYKIFPELSAGYMRLLIYTIFAIPGLFILGYLWSLVENIIDRKDDICADNIYKDKNSIKVFNIIEAPDLNVFKNIWRGFASIIGCVLLSIPFIALYKLSITPENLKIFSGAIRTIFTVFFVSFIPILLWNYARTNSILAVWDFPKAIYIMGNYSFRYFCRMILLVLLAKLSYIIDVNSISEVNSLFITTDIVQIIKLSLIFFICFVKYIYLAYIYAYLIGTITTTSEY